MIVLVLMVVYDVTVCVGVTVVVTAPDVTVGSRIKERVTPVLHEARVGYVAGSAVSWPEIGEYVPEYSVTVVRLTPSAHYDAYS